MAACACSACQADDSVRPLISGTLAQRRGAAGELGDLGPVALLIASPRHEPRAADADDVRQRQIRLGLLGVDAAGRAELGRGQRRGERLQQRRRRPTGLGREQLHVAVAALEQAITSLGVAVPGRSGTAHACGRVEQRRRWRPGLTANAAPERWPPRRAARASAPCRRRRWRRAPRRSCGGSTPARRRCASVTSSTRTPPATSASASGTACATSSTTITGMTGPVREDVGDLAGRHGRSPSDYAATSRPTRRHPRRRRRRAARKAANSSRPRPWW